MDIVKYVKTNPGTTGRITQYYYGREDYLRRNNITDRDLIDNPNIILQSLTAKERMTFGNLLAVVKRGRFYDFSVTDLDLSNGVWSDFLPDITSPLQRNIDPSGNLVDIITRFTYETDYQQVLTSSDPRFTESAVPNSLLDSQRFLETLTIYEYVGVPSNNVNLRLRGIRYPDVSLPDGSILRDIKHEYLEYDRLDVICSL